jgi:L-2-hydroxycarboxylate dehydrogenase (NAD+)
MFKYEDLHNLSTEIFKKIGCSDNDAITASEVLLSADLRGVDSHGVARLSGYVRLWEAGRINAAPEISVVRETPSTATLDGDAGLGLVVGPAAMKIAIQKAKSAGTGWVAVKNSNHFGIAGYHAMMALEHDMIGIALTNASPLVAPTFSVKRMLGTNPIAVAIPAHQEQPFVLDMATTTAANGKLEILQRKNLDAPEGWIQDAHGNSTTNPDGVKNGGALLPLGGNRTNGSHKGYGLGAMVDIFSAVLSGANYGPWVPPFVSFLQPDPNPVGQGLGHFFGAMRIDAFRDAEDFKAHMDNWIRTFKSAPVAEGQQRVIIPGEPEKEISNQRRSEGIPLLDPVVKDLRDLADKFGVNFVNTIA